MKSLICLLFLTIVSSSFAFSQKQLETANNVWELCVQEIGVNPEDARKLRADDFSVENDGLKCLANCFVNKIGFVKNGEIDKTAISEHFGNIFPKEKLDQLFNECKLQGENECERSFNAYKCYAKRSTELFKQLSGH